MRKAMLRAACAATLLAGAAGLFAGASPGTTREACMDRCLAMKDKAFDACATKSGEAKNDCLDIAQDAFVKCVHACPTGR